MLLKMMTMAATMLMMTMAATMTMAAGTGLSESVQKGREEGARLLGLKIYRHFLDIVRRKDCQKEQNKIGGII